MLIYTITIFLATVYISYNLHINRYFIGVVGCCDHEAMLQYKTQLAMVYILLAKLMYCAIKIVDLKLHSFNCRCTFHKQKLMAIESLTEYTNMFINMHCTTKYLDMKLCISSTNGMNLHVLLHLS